MRRMLWIFPAMMILLLALPAQAQDPPPAPPVDPAAAAPGPPPIVSNPGLPPVLPGQIGLTADQIYSIPILDLPGPAADFNILYDRKYRRLLGGTTVYNAPNGTPVRTIPAGFGFVTVLAEDQNGWTQINTNEWVRANEVEGPLPVSDFTGFFLPEVMPAYTIAWGLDYVYPSRVPGGRQDRSLPRVDKHQPLQLFATAVDPEGYRWYQIAPEQWIHQFDVAKVIPTQTLPPGVDTNLWISIDLYEQVMIVYEGMRPIFATLISSGLPNWSTREGVFKIYNRYTRAHMSQGSGDNFYHLEEVPWTMFFDNDIALHGTYWHDDFGYRRSRGCVNLSVPDSRWIYERVAMEMGSLTSNGVEANGVSVYVFSSGQY